jgi:ssDNA-binding Zn-finger/Zn-ribbon topoisomerase 1
MNAPKPPLPRPPLFMLIFMSMFGFIGLGVLIFVWSQPGDFPPLIFKFFASCIAIGFIAMGFGGPISMWKAGSAIKPNEPAAEATDTAPPVKGYQCPNCGAGLGSQEVSPSGDVKCTYCQKWWNIHRPLK